MPVDADIKDAGVLAGFVRWGWPWHGLCTGGVIGSSGKVVTQPATSDAWLIDMGLPDLPLTPEQVASESAAGREWRNYALISGGRVYDTALPDQSYIHVDEDNVPWMVTLSGAFPSTNVVRVTASIVRFGHFEAGAATLDPVIKTVDVACENSSLVIEGIGEPATWTYATRSVALHDVYTNGAKALLCIELSTYPDTVVTSAINVILSGAGGSDGSGLDLAAIEEKGQSSLTGFTRYLGEYENILSSVPGFNISVIDTTLTDCPSGTPGSTIMRTFDYSADGFVQWRQPSGTGFGGGYPAETNNLTQSVYCRTCCYGADGEVIANRLKYEILHDHWITSATPTVCSGQDYIRCDGTNVCGASLTPPVCNIAGVFRSGYYLMQNDTVVDYIEHGENFTGTQDYPDAYAGPSVYGCSVSLGDTRSVYSSTGSYWAGSLAASLGDPETNGFDTSQPSLIDTWLDPDYKTDVAVFLSDGVNKIGYLRTGFSASFFYVPGGGVRLYGPVMTQAGIKATSLTGGFYFAWQRKTGDYVFSQNPACYV